MAVRPMKVWNAATSTWDDVAVSQRGDVVNNTDFAAKGDIIAGTGTSAYDNLPAGNNGEVLTADSTTASGLRWKPDYNSGRNRIINGDFSIWQRGTSFSANQAYTADRWVAGWDSTPTVTISRQAFTAGTAPVAGLEGTYFFRTAVSAAASMTLLDVKQRIEDVRTFAGQTVTLSFYAKADATRTLTPLIVQFFGSGGSSDVVTSASAVTLTTSWARYSVTIAVPSISGKTIGTNSYLEVYLRHPGSTFTIDLWGVQVEAGSVATRFEEEPLEATLRKCQRYYQVIGDQYPGLIAATGTISLIRFPIFFQRMRAAPTITIGSIDGGRTAAVFYGYPSSAGIEISGPAAGDFRPLVGNIIASVEL